MAQHKPRNLEQYTTPSEAAAFLRRVAERVGNGDRSERVMVRISLSFFNQGEGGAAVINQSLTSDPIEAPTH